MNEKVGIAFISALVCAAICGCIGPAESPRSVEAIADEYLAAYLERHPEMGTYLSLPGNPHFLIVDPQFFDLAFKYTCSRAYDVDLLTLHEWLGFHKYFRHTDL